MQARSLHNLRPTMIFDPIVMRTMLSPSQQHILDDHVCYGCLPILLIDTGITLIIVRKRMYHPRLSLVPYSEVLYCSDIEVMHRHLERIKLAVMRRQWTTGLSLSSRGLPLLPDRTTIRMPSHAMFRSPAFAAHELDMLYSELVLFSI
jgi:acetoacetyl-CoA synthetase